VSHVAQGPLGQTNLSLVVEKTLSFTFRPHKTQIYSCIKQLVADFHMNTNSPELENDHSPIPTCPLPLVCLLLATNNRVLFILQSLNPFNIILKIFPPNLFKKCRLSLVLHIFPHLCCHLVAILSHINSRWNAFFFFF